MSKPKTTPWYPDYVMPLKDRPGVYQRKLITPVFSYWNGTQWGWFGKTVEKARFYRHLASLHCLPWRGLASDPKQGAEFLTAKSKNLKGKK